MNNFNEEKSDLAEQFFRQGYNCSQSVLAAWCEDLGLDLTTALKISSGFGGGIGRMREVCGALSGAIMVLGLKYGNTEGSNPKAKGENYKLVQEFTSRYKQLIGRDTIICRELLGISGKSDVPTPEKRTAQYYKKRPCIEMIRISSGLLGEFI